MLNGGAHVRGLYTVPNGSGAQFTDGCDAIWDLGLRTLKVYATPDYAADYPLQSSWSGTPSNLTELISLDEYTAQLSRGWDTVIFTTFTFANGTTNWWRADPSATRFANEYQEIYNLVVHLLTAYDDSGKTFILQNWEGDWAFMDSFNPDTYVPRQYINFYAAFLNIRQKAVSDARAATPHSNVNVYMCVELNRTYDPPNLRRILYNLPKLINPDVISYSAYDRTIVQYGWTANQATWEAAYVPSFTKGLRLIKKAYPNALLMIGEYGFPENEAINDHPLLSVGDMIQTVYDICREEGVRWHVYWEVFDNEASIPYTYRGYWFRKPDGSLSIAGGKFEDFGPGN